MNSHDLFRTLVHNRTGNPGEGPWEQHYPIAENVARVKPGDLIISDYETHRADKARKIVEDVCGLHNQVIVTDDGKLRGTVWNTLSEKPQVHFGDHQIADFESPRKFGIGSVKVTQHEYTLPEAFLVNAGMEQLALLCREARLTSFGRNRGIEIMQSGYNFPVLFCASLMLNRRFPGRTLLMSGRDCYMWVRLMSKLFGHQNIRYWQTSCLLRIEGDKDYLKYTKLIGGDNPVLIDLCGSGNSFSYMEKRGYECCLMFTPEKSKWNCPALYRGPDVYRLEQANRAPHLKCKGVKVYPNNELEILYHYAGVEMSQQPQVKTQCDSFFRAMNLLDKYKVPEYSNEQCLKAMKFLLPRYIDFAKDVEPLRQIDIREDA